jgi:hypothetical protein
MGVGPGTMMMASAAIGAVGTLYNISATKSANKREQARYERESLMAKIDAIEQENIRKDHLNRELANNLAFQSTAAYYDDSRSFLNINKSAAKKAEKDMANIRLMGKSVVLKYREQMFENDVATRNKVFGGWVSVGSGLTSGYAMYADYEKQGGDTDQKWWEV